MNFLETERLYINPFTVNDLPLLNKLHADEDVMKYHPSGKRSEERIVKDLDAIIEHQNVYGYSFWGVFEKKHHQFIGRVGLWHLDKTELVELGYSLFRQFWGQGYATEMSEKVLQFGFSQLNLSEIFAVIHPENVVSQKVAKKLGFCFLREAFYYNASLQLYQKNKILKTQLAT